MVYKIDCRRWGRFFSVPCSVVDEHIKLCDGQFLKVLLCVLCSNSDLADTAIISAMSGISEQTVQDALLYWNNLNIIALLSADESITHTDNTVLAQPPQAVAANTAPQKVKTVVKYSPKDLSEKIENDDELKLLSNDIQKILGRLINSRELTGLINLYEYYGFSAPSILMITEYCHKLGKDSFAYIERTAVDWFEKGIVSYSEVEAEIIRQSEIKSYEYKAAKTFGMSSKPSKRQLEYFSEWRNMGFGVDMLEIAYDKCMDSIKELKFSYIDTILKSWAGKSISTPEQVSEDDKQFSVSTKKKYNVKTENKDTSYDLDEWERYALNLNPNKRGDCND